MQKGVAYYHMKKFISKSMCGLISVALLGLSIIGCTNSKPQPEDPDKTPTIIDSDNVLLDDNWTSYQGKGALSLAIAAGNHGASAPRLVKAQPEGEWILHTHLTYLSADSNGDNHAGLTLYKDENNYLVWGPRNNGALVLSGKINGETTEEFVHLEENFAHLRIIKNLTDADCPRYYVYAANDAYYSWLYAGYFDDTDHVFDTAKIGTIGLDYSEASTEGFCAQYEFLNDYKMYMYKDYFSDPANQTDGRWLWGSQAAAVKNNVLYLSGEGDTPSLLLRNPLPYDFTIEAMVSDTISSDTYAGVCVNIDDSLLSIGVINETVEARMDDQLLGKENGTFSFVKIIQNHQGYSLRASTDGRSWQTIAEAEDILGDNLRYGLVAQDGKAAFNWFSERPTPNGVIKDVVSFEQMGAITGEDSINKTESNWGFGSGDLGSMFELNDAVYMVFGDTFEFANQRGAYYKNSMAKITDLENFENGPKFDWIKINPGNGGLVNSRNPLDPTSMIGTSGIGIEQDGVPTLYMHLMEIRQWTSHGTHWTVNGSGWASSTDDGNTWTLHERIFEGDTNFAQVACYQDGDYVYILGAGAGGEGPVKLCRVPAARLVEKDAYEFFIGTDEADNPQWSPKEEDAIVVIDSVNKEFGVVYNKELECFMMTTLDNVNQQMIMRDAKNIWGPWSMPVLLFDESYVEHEDIGQRFFYGSFMQDRFMENEGRTVYMTLNKWVPYNIQWMKVNFEVEEESENE